MKCICKYCGKECSEKNGALKRHESQCELNPNRIIRTLTQKYKIMSDDELLIEVKKYSSRKETPSPLIEICTKRKIYSWSIENPYKELTDNELINLVHTEYKDISAVELRKNYKLWYALNKHNLINIIFPNRKKLNRDLTYKKLSNDELLDLINTKYKDKSEVELRKINRPLVNLIAKRNLLDIIFPNRRHPKSPIHPEYKTMTDDELINIVNNKYKDISTGKLLKLNPSLYYILKNRNLLDIIFPNRRKRNWNNYHPEYKTMSDGELINIVNTQYKDKSISNILFLNRALINEIRKRNISDIVFPNKKILRSKQEKINLLTKYDLLSMSWTVILDLIGIDKLPSEFTKLCKYGENTPERKKMIQDLIDSYNIEVPENDTDEETNEDEINNDNIETEVNNITDEDTNIYDDENNELNPLKETKTIGEILDEDFNETLFSTGDKWVHIMSKEIGKIWNNVLRDNENHNENTINEIHQKLINNSLTKFEKYIYEEFMKEYDEVINLEIH